MAASAGPYRFSTRAPTASQRWISSGAGGSPATSTVRRSGQGSGSIRLARVGGVNEWVTRCAAINPVRAPGLSTSSLVAMTTRAPEVSAEKISPTDRSNTGEQACSIRLSGPIRHSSTIQVR